MAVSTSLATNLLNTETFMGDQVSFTNEYSNMLALRDDSYTTFPLEKESKLGTGDVIRRFIPPTPISPASLVDLNTAVIHRWEGRVLFVDEVQGLMQVLLSDSAGQEHTGEIELQWVADQDQELVKSGAIFYLTLYKQIRRGSTQNSQELRFRRRPAWSKQQIKKIHEDAKMLLSKMQSKPLAE
ncbi:MAG: hypothetical protein WAO71_11130 [Gallionella sp.]